MKGFHLVSQLGPRDQRLIDELSAINCNVNIREAYLYLPIYLFIYRYPSIYLSLNLCIYLSMMKQLDR